MNPNSPKFSPPKNGPAETAKNPRAQKASPGEPVFDVRESQVCAALGMCKDRVRERREVFLAQGQHWDVVANRVMYSRIGLTVLLGTKDATLPPASEKGAASGASAPVRPPVALLLEKNPPAVVFTGALMVWGVSPRNRRLVIAYLPGTDPENPLNLVSLMVRDNAHFLRGMAVPGPGRSVQQSGARSFDLMGALPRGRGRW